MSDRNWQGELIDNLTELANPDSTDRAILASLRRGLVGPLNHTLGRAGWLFRRVPDFALDDAVLTAGLFAWVKGDCRQVEEVNFGEAFGSGLTLDQKGRREKRFIDLLDTDREDLPYKLRQAITLIAGNPLDWVLLIRHLAHWSHPDRWVQKEWARGFWSIATEDKTIAVGDQAVSDSAD